MGSSWPQAGSGQADVCRVDAEPVDEVQNLELLIDARAAHRRRLQTVAQRGYRRRQRRDQSQAEKFQLLVFQLLVFQELVFQELVFQLLVSAVDVVDVVVAPG